MLFRNEAEREFKVSPVTSPQMDALINKRSSGVGK